MDSDVGSNAIRPGCHGQRSEVCRAKSSVQDQHGLQKQDDSAPRASLRCPWAPERRDPNEKKATILANRRPEGKERRQLIGPFRVVRSSRPGAPFVRAFARLVPLVRVHSPDSFGMRSTPRAALSPAPAPLKGTRGTLFLHPTPPRAKQSAVASRQSQSKD